MLKVHLSLYAVRARSETSISADSCQARNGDAACIGLQDKVEISIRTYWRSQFVRQMIDDQLFVAEEQAASASLLLKILACDFGSGLLGLSVEVSYTLSSLSFEGYKQTAIHIDVPKSPSDRGQWKFGPLLKKRDRGARICVGGIRSP